MNRKAFSFAVLFAAFFITACFPLKHSRLKGRYRKDFNRYEAAKKVSHLSVAGKRLRYAEQALEEAREAIKRWDHERAGTMLYLAEEHLDAIDNPPVIPESLRDLYAPPGEPFTPEAQFP